MTTVKDHQARRKQQREEADKLRCDTMDLLEKQIAPLTLNVPPNKDREGTYLNRTILSPSGEQLGRVVMGYPRRYGLTPPVLYFRVSSRRIPSRSNRYGGERRYTKFDSAVAAIKKFCIPTSDDESRAKVLRKELSYYHGKIRKSDDRHRCIPGAPSYYRPDLSHLIDLLADSEGTESMVQGALLLDTMVKKRRVHVRYTTWIKRTFVDPLADELASLDLSNEKVT